MDRHSDEPQTEYHPPVGGIRIHAGVDEGREWAIARLLVDAVNCREMVSSVEKAPAGIRYKGETKVVFKIKKSEKLAPKKLPMFSTNFSDAFKYLMMRRNWRRIVRIARGNNANPYIPGFEE